MDTKIRASDTQDDHLQILFGLIPLHQLPKLLSGIHFVRWQYFHPSTFVLETCYS